MPLTQQTLSQFSKYFTLHIHTLTSKPISIKVDKSSTLSHLIKLFSTKLPKFCRQSPIFHFGKLIPDSENNITTFIKKNNACLFIDHPKLHSRCSELMQFVKQKNRKFLEYPHNTPELEVKFIQGMSEELGLYHMLQGHREMPYLQVSKIKMKKSNIPKGISEVVKGFLYLGSGKDAQDKAQLKKYKINCILNVSGEWHSVEFHQQMRYKKVSLKDNELQGLMHHLDEIFEFLDEIRKSENSRVLVHCTVGRSRSAAIVIAYLMNRTKMSLKQAYEHVKAMRPLIKPNDGFIKQLMDYEKELFGVKETSLEWRWSSYDTGHKRKRNEKMKPRKKIKKE